MEKGTVLREKGTVLMEKSVVQREKGTVLMEKRRCSEGEEAL